MMILLLLTVLTYATLFMVVIYTTAVNSVNIQVLYFIWRIALTCWSHAYLYLLKIIRHSYVFMVFKYQDSTGFGYRSQQFLHVMSPRDAAKFQTKSNSALSDRSQGFSFLNSHAARDLQRVILPYMTVMSLNVTFLQRPHTGF